jgi:hypothetical protein
MSNISSHLFLFDLSKGYCWFCPPTNQNDLKPIP